MRIVFAFALAACALGCKNAEQPPPGLPDFDGSVSPGQGGGSTGGGGDAGGATDGGTALATASSPEAIVVADGFVYYTNSGAGTVSAVSTSGGTPNDLATGLDTPWALTVAAGTVYFTLAPTAGTGGVESVPTGGGSVTSIQQGVVGAVGLASDGTNLYWTITNGGVSIETVPLAGGTPKDVLDFGGDLVPTALALSNGFLYVATSGTQAAVLRGATTGTGNLAQLDAQQVATFGDVAVSQSIVYATIDDTAPNGSIVAYGTNGTPQTIASSLDQPTRLAIDGSHLYFTDPAGGNVWVKDLASSDAPVVFASGLSSPVPIAVADAVYVGASDAIWRFGKK